jgi:hypothetical protein
MAVPADAGNCHPIPANSVAIWGAISSDHVDQRPNNRGFAAVYLDLFLGSLAILPNAAAPIDPPT